MKNYNLILIVILFGHTAYSQCDSSFVHFEEIPSNITITFGDTCFYSKDIEVLDSIIMKNDLIYDSPLHLGTQTWWHGRLKFFVAEMSGNSQGVNDTIYELPNNIGQLEDLTSLYLNWNRISILPSGFSNLSNLRNLYINNNILTSIGDSVGNLSNLYILDLGYNNLSEIPESICELNDLNYLWLFNNQIDSLPQCFCNMNLNWNGDDSFGFPFFAIGANNLCSNVPDCVLESNNFELSLDQFYYSFPVYSPQDCDTSLVNISRSALPYYYHISMPYPNPFNPIVQIDLHMPHARKMSITIYNNSGREIAKVAKNEFFSSGDHVVSWDGEGYSSGVYFILFSDQYRSSVRKMMLLK